MANEPMHLGERFAAAKLASTPPIERRHRVVAWLMLVAGLAAFGYGLVLLIQLLMGGRTTSAHQERPGWSEQLRERHGPQIRGVLFLDIIRAPWRQMQTDVFEWLRLPEVTHIGPIPNLIVNAGETALRDCFGGTGTPTCTTVQNWKFHGLGTSSVAVAETDTGCGTELTTQYNPDNTRATGSQTNNGANVYRTVGTNTVDAAVTVQEFCLMSQAATGGGTMWTRILTGAIALNSGDSVQTTYDLTIE